ncbi:MAG: hypothetical protein ABIO24_08050, partial [Saprospiraceae bacterium]
MLIVETSAACLPEKTYSLEVLLRQLLGLEFQIRVTERVDYLFHLPNGATLRVEDHFFNQFPEGNYLHATHIPEQAMTFPQPYNASERLTAIYGRDQFELQSDNMVCGLDV